jgi:hypothetical protein
LTSEKFCLEHSGICRKLDSLKEEIELRFAALEKAMAATKADLNIRLEGMNEFRAQLDKQAQTFVPRTEIKLANDRLEDKLDILLTRSAEQKGSTKWIDHIITVLIGLAVIIIVWVIKT